LLFLFDRHPRLSASFWQHALDALARAQREASLLRGGTADGRVAAFLQMLAGREQSAGGELTMPMSRAEIGELLGLSAETVSRAISKLRGSGVIRPHSRHTFSIAAPARLRALASGDADG
jgi:CRP-like cAMP-binding protein